MPKDKTTEEITLGPKRDVDRNPLPFTTTVDVFCRMAYSRRPEILIQELKVRDDAIVEMKKKLAEMDAKGWQMVRAYEGKMIQLSADLKMICEVVRKIDTMSQQQCLICLKPKTSDACGNSECPTTLAREALETEPV